MIDLSLFFLFVILFFFFFFIFLWGRIYTLQKELKRETKELKETTETSFDKLLKKIEKEIEFLDGQPGLSEEEKKLRDKLFEIVGEAKEIIDKEIKDVEKKAD